MENHVKNVATELPYISALFAIPQFIGKRRAEGRETYKGRERRESRKRPIGRQREGEELGNSGLKDYQREGVNPCFPLPSSIL